MPYAEFSPQGVPGEASNALLQGLDAGQSMMERSQTMRLRQQQANIAQEQADRNRADYELLKPVVYAQRKAQIAEANNQLAGAVTMNDLTAQAQSEMPKLRSDWAQTYSITDPKKRLDLQEELLGNADRFASLKGTADEIKQWHEVWAQGQLNMRAKDQVTGRSDLLVQKQQFDQIINDQKAAHAVEIAKLKADTSKDVAEVGANSREKVAGIGADSRVAAAGAKEGAKVETEARKANTAVIQAGVTAVQSRAELEKGLEILKSVGTGKGAQTKLAAEQLGTMLGMDFSGAADAEQLQSIFGSQILAKVKLLPGAISDKEGARLEQYSASFGKTPEGNRRIILTTIAALRRAQDIAERVREARKQGQSESEIAGEIQDYQLRNPITAAIDGGLSPEKKSRLEELRAKAGK